MLGISYVSCIMFLHQCSRSRFLDLNREVSDLNPQANRPSIVSHPSHSVDANLPAMLAPLQVGTYM